MPRGLRALAVLAALAVVVFTAGTATPYDFCTYYSAGLLANEEGAAAAYDLERLNLRHAELHSHGDTRIGSFYYSPVYLAPAALLARLDFRAAQLLNQLVILLSLGGILFLMLEPKRPRWLIALLLLAFVLGDPVRIQFLYQNWSAVFVLLIVLAARQTLLGRYRSAVFFWALAFHLKLYAVLFLVPLWLIGRGKALGAGRETPDGAIGSATAKQTAAIVGRGAADPATAGQEAQATSDQPNDAPGAMGFPGAAVAWAGTRRLALGALALFVLLLALPLPWTGLDAPAAYLGGIASEAGGGLTVFYNQISIPATLARFARAPIDWVTSNRPVESLALSALIWLSLPLFVLAVWKLRDRPAGDARALALTVPYLLLFVPKMWDHGELLFLALFALAVLPRRVEAFAAGYLIVSFSYFALVQHLLGQALQGEMTALQVQLLLLFYPLLNLLAAVALLQEAPEGAAEPRPAPPVPTTG